MDMGLVMHMIKGRSGRPPPEIYAEIDRKQLELQRQLRNLMDASGQTSIHVKWDQIFLIDWEDILAGYGHLGNSVADIAVKRKFETIFRRLFDVSEVTRKILFIFKVFLINSVQAKKN